MANNKARKGTAACMLAGLAAVAVAVALATASPAPAPAEPAVPVAAKAAEVRDALAEGEEPAAGPGGVAPAEQAGQDATAVPAEPLDAPEDAVPEGQGGSEPNDALTGTPEPETPSGEQQAGSPVPAGGAGERRWVVDYERVWVPKVETVVDVPAHEEPIYETRDVLVCDTCGYEAASGNDMGSHLSAHAMKGVEAGYSAIPRKVQTGTAVVPAETHEVDNGHYETIETGHWE